MFVDTAKLQVRAGDGGAGSGHVHSEPYNPLGGPDGGDGGRGGDVIVRVDPSLFDLGPYRDRRRFRAANGGPGARNRRTGGDGQDTLLLVPDGTVIRDERGPVADLVGPGAEVVVARGGRGGRGTASLASARNRVPRVAEAGEPGEEHVVELELRLVADVGLVGLPNAGKSTLLAALTAARPKVADYPFTTLSPNLGVAGSGDDRWVVADVPGLIEGAHQGRGLGLTFLRHVSRCLVLAYVVDATGDASADLTTVREEVAAYDPELAARRSLIVGTKADLLEGDGRKVAAGAVDVLASGLTGEGIERLAASLRDLVAVARAEAPPPAPYVVVRPGRDPFVVERRGAGYRVSGPRVERWVAETDLDDERQVADLQRRLIRAGIERRLAAAGAVRGNEVTIGGVTFDFQPGPPPEGEPDADEG
jgi:GTP-binding protein